VHPFANVHAVPYQPPYEQNFVATPVKPAKDKEPASLSYYNPYSKSQNYDKGLQ
jgi:hypothetical protein